MEAEKDVKKFETFLELSVSSVMDIGIMSDNENVEGLDYEMDLLSAIGECLSVNLDKKKLKSMISNKFEELVDIEIKVEYQIDNVKDIVCD